MATIATTGAARSRTWTVRGAAVAAAIALSLLMATLSASPASANTPSTWSSTFGNGSSYGWTNDHAWAIVTYQDAIAYGSGFIAGQLCGVVSGEQGPLNPVSQECSQMVTATVEELTSTQPALTDHGLWVAYYLWPLDEISGEW